MVASPTKKLKSSVRSFVGAVAASTASRRGLSAAPAPSFVPSTSALFLASSKSKQSAGKLLTAQYHNFFHADAEPHGPSNESIAKLRETFEEQNCWKAELFLKLCPFHPNAEPLLLDAFSLADLDREPANKKQGSSFDPKSNEFSVPSHFASSTSSRRYYFPSEHKPSSGSDSWSKLYRCIQRCGYQSGSQLVCRKTAGRTGDRYELWCYRSLLHDPTTGLHQLNTESAEFASHAKAKGLRRSFKAENKSRSHRRGKKKKSEQKRGPKPGTKMLTGTKRPTNPEDQCSVRLVVFVDREVDRYYLKAGVGCNCHCKHPKLTLQEIVALSRTAPEDVQKTQHQLGNVQ